MITLDYDKNGTARGELVLPALSDPKHVHWMRAVVTDGEGKTNWVMTHGLPIRLLLDRKPKKDSESQKTVKMLFGANSGKHYGRIYSVQVSSSSFRASLGALLRFFIGSQRNPVHFKYFLTIGDWSARVNPRLQWGYPLCCGSGVDGGPAIADYDHQVR